MPFHLPLHTGHANEVANFVTEQLLPSDLDPSTAVAALQPEEVTEDSSGTKTGMGVQVGTPAHKGRLYAQN